MPDLGRSERRIVAGTEMTAEQEIEALRAALRWACCAIDGDDFEGEAAEDWGGALRLAWPDEPENW